MTFHIGSLFSGIGGLELGLERALAPLEPRVVWQVERDPFCRRVLARHWPEADRSVEDVTLATASNLARVDLICGGFPCQDVSAAGKRAGLAGARSGLWYEYARIVRELAPRFVVVENVASGVGRWLDPVCDHLDAMGYHPRPWAISAADVGAPHRRERVFIVADADRVRQLQPGWSECDERRRVGDGGSQGDVSDADREHVHEQHRRRGRARRAGAPEPARDGEARYVADADGSGLEGARDVESARRSSRARQSSECDEGNERELLPQPSVGRAPDGVSAWLDGWERGVSRVVGPGSVACRGARLRALGNAVVPQCAEAVGRVVLAMIRAAEAA